MERITVTKPASVGNISTEQPGSQKQNSIFHMFGFGLYIQSAVNFKIILSLY
jgi:hypothetical protein